MLGALQSGGGGDVNQTLAMLSPLIMALLSKAYKSYTKFKKTQEAFKNKLTKLLYFKNIDNNKGVLTLLQEAAPPPHKHADESDAEFILERCDTNHSGTITWAELQPAIATWMEIATETPPEKAGSSACVLL